MSLRHAIFLTLTVLLLGNTVLFGGNGEFLVYSTGLVAAVGLVMISFSADIARRTWFLWGGLGMVAGAVAWVLFLHYGYIPLGIGRALESAALGSSWLEIHLAQDHPMVLISKLLAGAFVFYAGYLSAIHNHSRMLLLRLLLGLQLGMALYGLVVYFLGNDVVLWYEKLAYRTDVTSTFINRNSYATFVGMGILLLFWFISRNSTKLELGEKLEKGIINSIYSVAALMILLVALVNTHSRAGLASASIALLVFLWLSGMASKSRLGPYLVAGILAVGLVVVAPQSERIEERVEMAGENFEDSRGIVYRDTLSAIESNPLLGFGAGSFERIYPLYQSADVSYVVFDKAHNSYLELAFEVGIPATLVLLALLLWLVIWILRRGTSFGYMVACCWLLVALHSFLDFSMQIPGVALLLFTLTGMAVGYPRKISRRRHPASS